jgi:iron(III) transport system ATP-binding protein
MSLQNTLLSINDLKLEYQGTSYRSPVQAVTHFNLKLHEGEIGCLLGPSGCGKSSVLRAICGFENLKQGTILLNNEVMSSVLIHIPTHLRNIGMVFQDFALFPHLNVIKNISFGLDHLPNNHKINQANKWLDFVSLSDQANSFPHELSGGQQQRVALARAMAPEPELILLDEPFSSMDLSLRQHLASELRKLLKLSGKTALIVTHDQTEAFTIADKIGVMKDGRLIHWDTPYNLFYKPTDKYVAEFLGQNFYLQGTVIAEGLVHTDLGNLILNSSKPIDVGFSVDVLLRFNDLLQDDQSPIKAKVIERIFRGLDFLYLVQLVTDKKSNAYLTSNQLYEVGKYLGISLPKDHVVTFVG